MDVFTSGDAAVPPIATEADEMQTMAQWVSATHVHSLKLLTMREHARPARRR